LNNSIEQLDPVAFRSAQHVAQIVDVLVFHDKGDPGIERCLDEKTDSGA
jgi:hypothetical protein